MSRRSDGQSFITMTETKSPTQELIGSIEADRARIIAAGIKCPPVPRKESYRGSHQYLQDLKWFRETTIESCIRRIGSPPMKKPKLTPASASVVKRNHNMVADHDRHTKLDGYLFKFSEFDGVEWFVCFDTHFWRVVEYTTGMSAGGALEASRAAAIEAQWTALESMRVAKNQGGSAQAVVELIKRAATGATKLNQ